MDRVAIAWAAGLFEGEGSIGSYTNARTIRACLDMTDRDVVEHFQEIIGMGFIRTQMSSQKPHYKTRYRWEIFSHERVQMLVAMLWPWLGSRRRDQAVRALIAHRAHLPDVTQTRAFRMFGQAWRQLTPEQHRAYARESRRLFGERRALALRHS